MWVELSKNQSQNQILGSGPHRLPLVGPEPRQKNAPGGTRSFSSSAMSSGRLFLDRVGRQHSPSPLHRHAQTYHALLTCLGKRGHFYFARKRTFLLCLDTGEKRRAGRPPDGKDAGFLESNS